MYYIHKDIYICIVSEGVVSWEIDQLILQTALLRHTCNPVGHGHRLTVTVKKRLTISMTYGSARLY